MKKILFCAVLFVMATCVQAGLGVLANPSFEDPALDAGDVIAGVTDWWDAALYTYTQDEGSDAYPETTYGDNWVELGKQRWIYQQIGTYEEGMELEISFLTGDRSDKKAGVLNVALLVGGNPALAADASAQFLDFAVTTNPLVGTVGAAVIAVSADIVTPDDGSIQEQSVVLSTGTGFTVGDPLWLQILNNATKSRALIDNVAVTVVPEPATMALLAMGSIAALRRKRK